MDITKSETFKNFTVLNNALLFLNILLSSILVNNRVIVIENRQKIFQLQLHFSTFENF